MTVANTQEVIDAFKSTLKIEEPGLIKTSGALTQAWSKELSQTLPYQHIKVQFENDELYQRAVKDIKTIEVIPGIKSRVMKSYDIKNKGKKELLTKQIENIELNIVLTKIPAELDHDDLYKMFDPQDNDVVFSCKVSKKFNEDGTCESNHYGYVSFNNKEDAKAAIEKSDYPGDMKACEFDVSKKNAPAPQNNLYVNNFPEQWSESDLSNTFREFGELGSTALMTDQKSGKKFGFVCYKEPECAKKAIEGLANKVYDGCSEPITVAFAVPKEKRKEALAKALARQNLHVRNLPENCQDEDLKKFFESYGKVKNAKVMTVEVGKDPVGLPIFKSKGFGFVCFDSAADAVSAMTKKDHVLDGNTLTLSYYEPKHERKAKLQRVHQKIDSSDEMNQAKQFSEMFQQFFNPFMNQMMQRGGNAPQGGQFGGRGGFNRGRGGARGGFGGRGGHQRPPQMMGQPPMMGAPARGPMPGGMAPPPMGAMPPMGGAPMNPPVMGGAPPVMGGPPPMGAPTQAPPAQGPTYEQRFEGLINSPDYQGADEAAKKNKIGDFIYPFVVSHSNDESAPKITGMIIDLDESDLRESVSTLASLKEKVTEGKNLLHDEN